MITHKISAFEREISALCMGTMNMGETIDEAASFQMLDMYAEMGGNFIDTARVYGAASPAGMGASERIIGHWLRARANRKQFILATKGGHPPIDDMSRPRLDKDSLTADLDASLEALGVDTIDLYWLHRDDESRPVEDILKTLNGFIEQRKIRAIGASNWSPKRLREAWGKAFELSLTGFCASQPLWSLATATNLADPTLKQMDADAFYWHEDSNMACVPYTSQAKGFFYKMESGGEAALSEKARTRYLTDANVARYNEAHAIAEELGIDAGSVALAFLIGQKEFPVCPIVGASSASQVEALKAAADAKLTADQMERLMKLTSLRRKED